MYMALHACCSVAIILSMDLTLWVYIHTCFELESSAARTHENMHLYRRCFVLRSNPFSVQWGRLKGAF